TSADGETDDKRPGAGRGGRPGQRPVRGRWAGARAGALGARPAPDRRLAGRGGDEPDVPGRGGRGDEGEHCDPLSTWPLRDQGASTNMLARTASPSPSAVNV